MLTLVTTRPRPRRWSAALIAGAALGVAVLAGCSNDNVDCGLNQCTVTLDNSVDASASVLGVEAKVVGVDGDKVTLEVAGEQVSLTVGQQATQVAGLNVALAGVTPDNIRFTVSK